MEKWSAMCYISGSVSLRFFLVYEKNLNIIHICLAVLCQCKNVPLFSSIDPFLYPVECTVLCKCYSTSEFCHILLINQSETKSFNIGVQWMKPNLLLLFYRECAVCWCLPNLLWPPLSMSVLSNRKHKYITASDLYLNYIKIWHSLPSCKHLAPDFFI